MTFRAFGLDLAPTFPVPGLDAASPDSERGPTVEVEQMSRRAMDAAWPRGASRLFDQRSDDGRVLHRIETDPEAGYRLTAQGWGSYTVNAAGAHVACAPPRAPRWKWQRYLIGQVLPFVATMRGLEVFHASAVARGDAASIFVGASRAGKSSVAAALLLRGWQLAADDVASVERGPTLHPGPGLMSVRYPTVDALSAAAIGGLGSEIGRDDEGIRLAVSLDPRPRAIAAIYVLDRNAGAAALSIDRLDPVDPRLLLGATFNLTLQTPERLMRQLDICAELAQAVPVYTVRIPKSCGPADVAAAIDR